MGKYVSDSVLDASHNKTATATRMTVCSAQPVDFADIANVDLASGAMDAGDFSIANGDTSGRKVTVAQQSDLAIGTSGDGTHVALDDGVELLRVTTCALQSLTAGGTVTVPAHDYEIEDPA